MPRTNLPDRSAVYRSHFRAGRCLPGGDVLGPPRCAITLQEEIENAVFPQLTLFFFCSKQPQSFLRHFANENTLVYLGVPPLTAAPPRAQSSGIPRAAPSANRFSERLS